MDWFRALINSGLTGGKNPIERRSILLSNQIGLILFSLSLVLTIAYLYWYGWNVVTVAIPVIGLLSLSTPFLNKTGHNVVSRIWITVSIPIITTALSIYAKSLYYESQAELDYFTFRFVILATCVFPFILFSFTEKKLLFACSAIGLIVLLSYDPLHSLFGVGYRQDTLKVDNYYFTNVVIFITYCIIAGAILFLKYVSERNERKLNESNVSLREKNLQIEAQTAELLAQSDSLHLNQEKLTKAYAIIEEQKDILFQKNRNLASDLLERNRELTETNTELIKHNNELMQFSYTVSHNLRGPVASIMGIHNLIDRSHLTEENCELLSHLDKSIQKLDGIIKDLFKIIDIRNDIFKIRQKIYLTKELTDIKQILKKEIEQHHVIIKEDFSECDNLYSVKPMVSSIIYNLISNSIKYRSFERNPEISIKTTSTHDEYIICIRDNGLGIDLKQQTENLFKLYKRFHQHTEGKGLGLYLVKLQAEALGGYIKVESELNRFTQFTVHLRKPENIERQILYKESHATIFFDARINATGIIWNGPLTSQQYRSVFYKCLEFVKAYNTPNYLADISNQGEISPEDQQWMFREILPEAVRSGMRYITGVRPDVKNPVIIEYLRGINESLVKLGARQEFFATMQEATDAIQEQNEIIQTRIKNG